MPPFLKFILSRLGSILTTLLIITAILYGFVMLTPPEVRASLYLPKRTSPNQTEEQARRLMENIIARYHLRDPYPLQYIRWASHLIRGEWGWSPILHDDVLAALLRRTPVSAELAIYSLLLLIPLGLISGVIAGWKYNTRLDHNFRLAAFIGTSVPVFILALVLMALFYVALHWFPPERLSISLQQVVKSPDFKLYTGLLTIDGFLNRRADISLDAIRHLVLPVVVLSLYHWATLTRVMRATMIEELQKEYITAGKARGISSRSLVWRHAFRNSLSPALTSSALSAASLFTGVFIVEVIFNLKGVSDIAVRALEDVPDASSILGFAIYSVIVVLLVMFLLDIIQALFDPRIREGIIAS